jgi:hypothetical protein
MEACCTVRDMSEDGPITNKPRKRSSMIAVASGLGFLSLVLLQSPPKESAALESVSQGKVATMQVARSFERRETKQSACKFSVTHLVESGYRSEVVAPVDTALMADGWEYENVPSAGPIHAVYRKVVQGEVVTATLSVVAMKGHDELDLEFQSAC